MPRSKRPRVSKVIVIPTLAEVKVDVPVKYGQHASSSFMTKAHSFIKRVYSSIAIRRPVKNYSRSYKKLLAFELSTVYIGKQKKLGEGMYHGPKMYDNTRTSIPPVKTRNPTKVHPRTEARDIRVLKPIRTKLVSLATK